MIIHHSENLKLYNLFIQKTIKYSNKFAFIPISFKKIKYMKNVFYKTHYYFHIFME